MKSRYFELYQHGKPLNHSYEDKWAEGIDLADINAKLIDGVEIREISKKEFDVMSIPKTAAR